MVALLWVEELSTTSRAGTTPRRVRSSVGYESPAACERMIHHHAVIEAA